MATSTPWRRQTRSTDLTRRSRRAPIPHQANIGIINAAIDVLHILRSKVYNNLDRYGNTLAGSVPLALDEARAEGRVEPGQLAVLSGFGAGLSWGTTVIRW
jgi:3-oxoacyl-[acyl-carrier-protein] synthase-3